MLDYLTLQKTVLNHQPFPYMVEQQAIEAQSLEAIVHDFPTITSGGSIPMHTLHAGPAFQALVDELESEAFRELMAEKFTLTLTDRPVVTTARGYMRRKDGRVHTDSKTKLLTVLMYFNPHWNHAEGQLRILNSNSIDDCAAEISPLAGTLLAFEVKPNCWHGHLPVEGPRLSLQLNYLHNQRARSKHHILHSLSATFKNALGR